MLTSASDYKYQQTGNYDVTRTPVYAAPSSLAPNRPLFYSDMLYLSEAYICCAATLYGPDPSPSRWASYALPSTDNLPLKVTTLFSQGMSPSLLLSFIRSLYNAQTFVDTSTYFNAAATFAGYFVPYGNHYLKENASFVADFALPDLDSLTDFTPDSPGDPLSIGKYLKAWNAIAKLKRIFYSHSNLTRSGSYTVKSYRNGELYSDDTHPESHTDTSFGGMGGRIEHSDPRTGAIGAPTWDSFIDSSWTVTIPTTPNYLSIAVNGIIVRATGGDKLSSGADYSFKPVYYFAKSPTSINGNSITMDFTSQEAQSYIDVLGVDTSKHSWFASVEPAYLDVTYTFRHEI